MHKNKNNKLCKINENTRGEWKMIDGKTKKTYIELNETMRNKWDERKKEQHSVCGHHRRNALV